MKSLALLTIILTMTFSSDITTDSVYEFEPLNINGKETSLAQYKGNVLLIVNTASECGYTPQYEGLQALYEKYGKQGLIVLGFPANNFGGQEPGTDKEIKKFCNVNYDVTFPLFSKISVKGKDQHPLFTYLTNTSNADFKGKIKWNFEKFLIDRNGNLIHRFRSDATPQGTQITKAIELALKS